MKRNFFIVLSPIIIAIILIIGIYLGRAIGGTNQTPFIVPPKVDKLHAVMNYIAQDYVDEINQDSLVEMAIPKLLEELDPHSMYIPASDMQEVNEPIEGNFDGIGVMFNIQKDTIVVINTIHGGPSEKIGVMAGDRIVYVEDSLFAGVKMSTQKVMKALKGKRGTTVNIKVKRKGFDNLIPFSITRDKIPLKSVDVTFPIDDKTVYIKISKFALNTYQEFIQAIRPYKRQGYNSWMIDLRGNGGGVMQAAVQIADEFLEQGNLIVYTEGRSRPRADIMATNKGMCKQDDVIILIDEWSASASEILTGALQDNDRGAIVGRRSFGKGLVQEPAFFGDGSGIRLTIARYYTPTGRCIQKDYTNMEDYQMDISNRFLHGEFAEQDSIHFADSLRFETKGGKVVYGGGGIMPDYFVPVDTLGYSDYFRDILSKSLIYKYAFDYSDKHRNKLKTYTNYKQLNHYLKKSGVLQDFIRFAEKNKVPFVKSDFKISKNKIENYLLAYINRNTLDDEGFYPTIIQEDITVQKGIDLLNSKTRD